MLGLTQLSNYLTLKGSFSAAAAAAVSKPNVASKYASELAICWKALAEIYKMRSFAPPLHRSLRSNVFLKITKKFAFLKLFC